MLLSSENFEEDCRNVAAECVGHLALLYPHSILPSLKNNINSPSENIRYMIVAGIRSVSPFCPPNDRWIPF